MRASRCLARLGLIPAWAGKTGSSTVVSVSSAAHPRVGGENPTGRSGTPRAPGSSPRGRGKRRTRLPEGRRLGLIPAWAGKTHGVAARVLDPQAHPRVGGENGASALIARAVRGLIPAWAGKTSECTDPTWVIPAHPRVGGENFKARSGAGGKGGSSPRGRGKPAVRARRG